MSGGFSRKNEKSIHQDEPRFDWFDMAYEKEFPPLAEECDDTYYNEDEDIGNQSYSEAVHRDDHYTSHDRPNLNYDGRGHQNKEDHYYESTHCLRYREEHYANERYSSKRDHNYDPARYTRQQEQSTARGSYSSKSDQYYEPARNTSNHEQNYRGEHDSGAQDIYNDRGQYQTKQEQNYSNEHDKGTRESYNDRGRYQRKREQNYPGEHDIDTRDRGNYNVRGGYQRQQNYVSDRYQRRSDHHYKPERYQQRQEQNYEPKQTPRQDTSKEQWNKDEYVNTPGVINISSKEQWIEIMKTQNQSTSQEVSQNNDSLVTSKEHVQQKEEAQHSVVKTASKEKLDKSSKEEWIEIMKILKAQSQSISQKVSKNKDYLVTSKEVQGKEEAQHSVIKTDSKEKMKSEKLCSLSESQVIRVPTAAWHTREKLCVLSPEDYNYSTEITVNLDSAYGHFDNLCLISADKIKTFGRSEPQGSTMSDRE